MGLPSIILDYFEADMQNRPGKWRVGQFAAENDRGDRIWIANGYYGVELTAGGATIGGVTLASAFFGWAIPWRRRARRLVNRLVIARVALSAANGSGE
jgi:hypothetical protein